MADAEIVALRRMFLAMPRPQGLAERRQRLDSLTADYSLPSDIRVESIVANGVPAEWSSSSHADPSRAILFLHGGGYVSGSIVSHRPLATEIGRATGVCTLAVGYRLAPENPFPGAIDDVLAAYKFLLTLGLDPKHIAIAGDSAGGGLTVAVMVAARDAKIPPPACGWCISPWVDLEMLGHSMQMKADIDPLIQRPYLLELAAKYLNGVDPRTPLAAPLHADLHGLPPLLIQVGSAETLLDDSIRLAQAAGAADVVTTVEIWPEMIHAWPLFHYRLAAGRRTISRAADFLKIHLNS
jgi:acetyl esterase/lipase